MTELDEDLLRLLADQLAPTAGYLERIPDTALTAYCPQAVGTLTSEIEKSPSVESELKRLREENRQLKMERDILKKATAFFAKENS